MTKNRRRKLLLVDDDELFVKAMLRHLSDEYEVVTAESAETGLKLLEKNSPDLILLDIALPGYDGIELLKKTTLKHPDIPVVMLTALNRIDKAVECIKLGAYDYLTKPVDDEHLIAAIERSLEAADTKRELDRRRNVQLELNKEYRLIGDSPSLKKIRDEIRVLAKSDVPVLIQGETGTGKELVARNLHAFGPRANSSFVALNCGAIPKDLMESELFGHKKGAFTGALKDEIGKFQLAHQGTLLLDEISEMSDEAQVKLLRVLEEEEFYPVGSSDLRRVDVRILASTNRNLKQMMANGEFREDLYFRLNVYTITIPPLRERPDDILTLAHYFLHQYNPRYGKHFKEISADARQVLLRHPWQGNVRELSSVIERVILVEEGTAIEQKHLHFLTPPHSPAFSESVSSIPRNGLERELEAIEKKLILRALELTHGNVSEAAIILKLSRAALDYRLHKYRLN